MTGLEIMICAMIVVLIIILFIVLLSHLVVLMYTWYEDRKGL